MRVHLSTADIRHPRSCRPPLSLSVSFCLSLSYSRASIMAITSGRGSHWGPVINKPPLLCIVATRTSGRLLWAKIAHMSLLITQPPVLLLNDLWQCLISDGDFISFYVAAYLRIEHKPTPNTSPPPLLFLFFTAKAHWQTKTETAVSARAPPFPFSGARFPVLILLLSLLACFPITGYISTFVKSIRMRVMNILQLWVCLISCLTGPVGNM